MTRLSVNINDECAEALRRVKAARGIDTTEAIRRAISLLDYFEKTFPPSCTDCGHPNAWHDAEDDGMCAKADCYCQHAPKDERRCPHGLHSPGWCSPAQCASRDDDQEGVR